MAVLILGLGFLAGTYLEIKIKDSPNAEISVSQTAESVIETAPQKNPKTEEISNTPTEEKSEQHKLYEKLLNGFIKDLSAKSMTYRKNRRMLVEVTSPYNYETPEYAKETYKLFAETIAPKLRKMSSEVIETFEIYDKKIRTSIASLPEKDRTIFTKQWQNMLRQQTDVYVRFFENEEKVIQVYHDLTKFYFSKSMSLSIDEQTGAFVFQSEEDRLEEQNLKKRITALEDKKPKNTPSSP